MIINRAKTEQLQLEKNDTIFPLYRLINQDNCYVLADTLKDEAEEVSNITKGTNNTTRTKPTQVCGKTSFSLYIESNEVKKELMSFLYRNLDLIILRRTMLETKESFYAICSVEKESLDRIMQSTTFKGELEFYRYTEWLQDIELEENDDKETVEGDKYPLTYPFTYSSFVKASTTTFFGSKSNGHLPPFFLIYIQNGFNPVITLTDENNISQIIEFKNTTLVGSDTLIIDNRKGPAGEWGMRQTLNGKDYFGNTKFNSNVVTLPSQANILREEYNQTNTNNNYVTWFNLKTMDFTIKVENAQVVKIIPVHRFIKL